MILRDVWEIHECNNIIRTRSRTKPMCSYCMKHEMCGWYNYNVNALRK